MYFPFYFQIKPHLHYQKTQGISGAEGAFRRRNEGVQGQAELSVQGSHGQDRERHREGQGKVSPALRISFQADQVVHLEETPFPDPGGRNKDSDLDSVVHFECFEHSFLELPFLVPSDNHPALVFLPDDGQCYLLHQRRNDGPHDDQHHQLPRPQLIY